MNCIKQLVLRHIRLRASAGTLAFGAENGSVMRQLTQLMCTSTTHSPDQIVDRVVRLVKKFDKIDASKVVKFLFHSFFFVVFGFVRYLQLDLFVDQQEAALTEVKIWSN